MYFDFEDRRPDTPTLAPLVSVREGVLMSIIVHLLIVIAIIVAPELPWVKAAEERRRAEQAERLREQLERQREEAPRFVFMRPPVETPPPAPPQRAELSDVDRRARSVERAPEPRNTMPFARGNTTERVIAAPEVRPAPEARATPGPTAPPEPEAAETEAADTPIIELRESPSGLARREPAQARSPSTGILSDAIRNVQRYAQQDGFVNLQGQTQEFGPFINFDSKGVEFGPWIARFVAQVRRNWFIPIAAMTMRGHVVVTFFVHKDGRITDVTVTKPSAVEAFTLSARNAILASNPTVALPPEYPDDRAFFTVTFFFNESPP
jgi:TonB family protein